MKLNPLTEANMRLPTEPGQHSSGKGALVAVPVRSHTRRKPRKPPVYLSKHEQLREEVAMRQFDSEWEALFDAEVARDPAFACDAGLVG